MTNFFIALWSLMHSPMAWILLGFIVIVWLALPRLEARDQ